MELLLVDRVPENFRDRASIFLEVGNVQTVKEELSSRAKEESD